MEHKYILGCLLLIVLAGSGNSEDVSELISGQGLTGIESIIQGGASAQPDCVTKLLPCKDYLKSTSPPASCCLPLNQMITDEAQCLCAIISNADLLKQFNTTKDDAINLAKACGANPDLSVCRTAGSPTSSPPSPPASNSPGGSSAKNSTSDKSGAADWIISPSGSFGVIVSSSIAALLLAA